MGLLLAAFFELLFPLDFCRLLLNRLAVDSCCDLWVLFLLSFFWSTDNFSVFVLIFIFGCSWFLLLSDAFVVVVGFRLLYLLSSSF